MAAAGTAMERVSQTSAAQAASSRAYWLCQLLGWGGYGVLYYLMVLVPFHNAGIRPAAADLAYCLGGLAGTHGLRTRLRRGWNELPWSKLIPRLVVGALLAGVFLTAVLEGTLTLEQQVRWERSGDWLALLLMITLSGAGLVGLWLAVYLVVHAVRRRRSAEVDALRAQVLAREAQLRVLRQQLNPHFLFNCLNSLRGMIDEDRDRARAMVTRLAELLRASLRRDETGLVPMHEELAIVDAYLELESVRLEERLRIRKEIGEGVTAALVPPMLLEGLVENAVKHGVARLPEGGELTLLVAREGERLRVAVTNSGTLRGAAYRAIRPESGSGIGLSNARERLRLLFGDQASLELREDEPGVVQAVLEMPFATEPVRPESALEAACEPLS